MHAVKICDNLKKLVHLTDCTMITHIVGHPVLYRYAAHHVKKAICSNSYSCGIFPSIALFRYNSVRMSSSVTCS